MASPAQENQAQQQQQHEQHPFQDPRIRSYDVHVYFFHTSESSASQARALHSQVKELFPHLLLKFWAAPIGPHGIANFEINLKSPAELASFLPWIQLRRGSFSVLVHPNTGYPLDDHTVNAMWIGQAQVLDLSVLSNQFDPSYGWF
jgi:DOPA 4,5-dioxygenase